MDTPQPSEPDEPPLTCEEQVWFAQLLSEAGPAGAHAIADWLGIDL